MFLEMISMRTQEHFGQFISRKIITCPGEIPGRFFCKKHMETSFRLRAKVMYLWDDSHRPQNDRTAYMKYKRNESK